MKTDPAPGTRVRFGTFEADLRSGELHRNGLKVKIQELPFQVLVLLLERPGEVVTREDLRSRLWPADTFVDFEQGLNKAINKLREALGDDANNPRFVETLTRRGYRFIAPVDADKSSREPGPNAESAGGNKGPTSSKRRILIAIAGVLLVVAVMAMLVWWRKARNGPPAPSWSGEILPGPNISSFPTVSPDGHRVAFVAMENNIAQVAVMDPGAGNWRLLTHDRTHGATIGVPSWSQDGSTIYFDRIISQPAGIYSVSALGGEERLVLADAAGPQALPDGSLLVVRIDPDRQYQIYRFWPATGRLQAMGACVSSFWPAPMRVFRDGSEAAFVGYLKGRENNLRHLYLLHIATGKTNQLPPQPSFGPTSLSYPLAVTPDSQSILIDLPSGNLHRIVAIPRLGNGPNRTLLTLSTMPLALDAAPDGSLYVDQVDRPMQVLRFTPSGGVPEVLASIDSFVPDINELPVEFSDGRILIPAIISGHQRLLLTAPGGNPFPLLATNEGTMFAARIDDDRVALIDGNPPMQALAIASVKEGRIIRRFTATEGKRFREVAASPDGKSLYYVSSETVWSISSQGGDPRKICAGDGVAVGPDGRELIVKLNEKEHPLLERVPLSGSKAQPIQVRSNIPIAPYTLAPNALNKDGKLLVVVAPKDSWFYGVAILDIATGKLTLVPLNSNCDIQWAGWTSDGRILATGSPLRSNIWRFRPAR